MAVVFCSRLYSILSNYCEKTSLHGLRYITSPQSHWVERLLWLAISLLAMGTSIILILTIWTRFKTSPTVITVASTNYPMVEVPFPSVTICNSNKVYRPFAHDLANKLSREGLNSTLFMNYLEYLPRLIKPRPDQFNGTLKEVEDFLTSKGINTTQLMKMLAQPCHKLLVRCLWLGVDTNCSKLFQVIKSVEGICCSFNYQALYPHLDEASKLSSDVLYVTGADVNAGLDIILDCEPAEYMSALHHFYGVYVLLHDPQDYPEMTLRKSVVQPGHSVIVNMDAELIESEANVRRLDPDTRNCWFDDEERVLHTSPEYSYQTCLTECRSEAVMNRCGCIPFYYPQNFAEPVRLCGVQDESCLFYQHQILSSKFSSNHDGLNCSCLEQCSDKTYNIETHTIALATQLFQQSFIMRNLNTRNVSELQVYFGKSTCIKYQRSANMTWDVLFATFGGIIGLCMGGSMLSLIEAVYFFTIRLFFSTRAINNTITSEVLFAKSKRTFLSFQHTDLAFKK